MLVVMLVRTIMHQENILTVYMSQSIYMQLMVVCIYPYIILKWFQLSHVYYNYIIIYTMPSNETLQCSEDVLPT